MAKVTEDLPHAIWVLVGMIAVAIVANYIFLDFVQPLLISIDPIFDSSASGYPGRYPNSPAQIILYLFLLSSIFLYYILLAAVFHDETTVLSLTKGVLYFLYIFLVLLPIGIMKRRILPALGVDRWKLDQKSSDDEL